MDQFFVVSYVKNKIDFKISGAPKWGTRFEGSEFPLKFGEGLNSLILRGLKK